MLELQSQTIEIVKHWMDIMMLQIWRFVKQSLETLTEFSKGRKQTLVIQRDVMHFEMKRKLSISTFTTLGLDVGMASQYASKVCTYFSVSSYRKPLCFYPIYFSLLLISKWFAIKRLDEDVSLLEKKVSVLEKKVSVLEKKMNEIIKEWNGNMSQQLP